MNTDEKNQIESLFNVIDSEESIDSDHHKHHDHSQGSHTCNCNRTTHRTDKERKALVNRCSRIEGQIRGIKGMLDKDVYCDDILNQIAAAQSALNALSRVILERHMKTCLIDRIQSGDSEVIDELMVTVNRMMK